MSHETNMSRVEIKKRLLEEEKKRLIVQSNLKVESLGEKLKYLICFSSHCSLDCQGFHAVSHVS